MNSYSPCFGRIPKKSSLYRMLNLLLFVSAVLYVFIVLTKIKNLTIFNSLRSDLILIQAKLHIHVVVPFSREDLFLPWKKIWPKKMMGTGPDVDLGWASDEQCV